MVWPPMVALRESGTKVARRIPQDRSTWIFFVDWAGIEPRFSAGEDPPADWANDGEPEGRVSGCQAGLLR